METIPIPAAPASAKRRWRPDARTVVGWLYLALSLAVLIYYISGPALAYFHADCADSLLWSQVMVETGEILSDEFHYAALLPFGSPLWMVPVLWIFGYTMTAQVVSMVIFAVLFVLAAYSLFRALKAGPAFAGIGTFCLSMLLSGSVKLREILWEHVIYYSLGLLLLMVLLNLCLRLADRMKRWSDGDQSRRNTVWMAVYAALLLLVSIGCGTDGLQVLVICAVPVFGGCIATAIFDNRPLLCRRSMGRYARAAIVAAGMVLGLLLLVILTKGGQISAGYENAFSGWSAMEDWPDNAERFFPHYLSLFGIDVEDGARLFSAESVLMMLKLAAAILILVCPVLLLLRYRHIENNGAKLVLWAHLILTLVILLGFVCGTLSSANWRLTPLIGSGALTTLVYFRELWHGSDVEKRVSAVLTAVVLAVSVTTGATLLSMPRDAGDNQKYLTLTAALEEKGYTRGYATFWHAGNTTLLSDGEVWVANMNAGSDGFVPYRYQTLDRWFEDQEGQETYFLMFTEGEYQQVSQSSQWQEFSEQTPLYDSFTCEGFRIFVYTQNPF